MKTDPWLDPTRAVRPGEELDAAWLERCLLDALPGTRGPLTLEQFPSGHSNLTYRLGLGDRELVLRRPPFGAKAITAGHDMEREFKLLQALHPSFGKVPKPLLFRAEDASPLGAPFYVMERVFGLILRNRPPKEIALTPERMRTLSQAFVDQLAALHALDLDAAGLAGFGKPAGYLARQVQGWTGRYQKARTDDLPDVDAVAAWLAAHTPAEAAPALIHNDFKYDNLVLDPDSLAIRAVLDWEMATVGDPLSDLGMALAYWIQADDPPEVQALNVGLTSLPGNLSRRELVERYAGATGRDVSGIHWHYVLSLFKVCVIAQQIYARFHAGLTRDERFGRLIGAVRVLSALGARVIETGDLRPVPGLR